MNKINILFMLAVLILATSVSASDYMNAAAGDNPFIIVSLINQQPDPVEPGSIVEVRFKLENYGSVTAEEMSVEILPDYPFSILPGELAIKSIGNIQSRQIAEEGVIVKFKLKVDENAVEGDNDLELKYTVKRDNIKSSQKPEPFTISIQTHDAILAVEDVSSIPSQLAPGQKATIKISIKNMADSLLKDIKATLKVLETTTTASTVVTTDYPFSPIGSTNEKTIAQLDSGKTADIEFDLVADPDAEAKVYRVPLTLEYSDELNANYTKELIVGLIVGERPDLVVNLDSTDLNTAGKKGTATLRFVNKGTNNIKFAYVTLEESEQYEILSAANTYIGKIDSDDYETIDFDLYIGQDETEVSLPVTIEYKDANNKDYKEEIKVALPIYTAAEAKKYG